MLALATLLIGTLGGCASSDGIGGTPPTYQLGGVSEPPNAGAIVRRIWVPGLDEYFDPQGLVIVGRDVLVSGYVGRGVAQNKGRCRVYRVDMASGAERGHFDLDFPYTDRDDYNSRHGNLTSCGHAGGLAYADGHLFLTDTNLLFLPSLESFGQTALKPPVLSLTDSAARPFRGGVAGADPGAVWIGAEMADDSASLYRFDAAKLAAAPPNLAPRDSTACVPLSSDAQGAAVDRDGSLWIARSDIAWGLLDHVDNTGKLLGRYRIPAATEGIDFDASGRLWGVSEAGARRIDDYWLLRAVYPLYRLVVPFHPLIYAIDVSRLQKENDLPERPNHRCQAGP